jgi:lysozyme
MDMSKLVEQLIDHEGERLFPYSDTVGKLTIGVGRNLTDVGISKEESRLLLYNDIEKVVDGLDAALPWWDSLSEARQRVLADMAFNLGLKGLLGFKNTLALIQAGDYDEAADNMLLSKWATQVGRRAQTLAGLMRRGI